MNRESTLPARCPYCDSPTVWRGRRARVFECDSGYDYERQDYWREVRQSLICHLTVKERKTA